jgi:hypothetical protein
MIKTDSNDLEQKNSMAGYVLAYVVPGIVNFYMLDYAVTEDVATERLFESHLYELLADTKTGLWHLSTRLLARILHQEITTGRLDFPEEAA